MKNENEKGNDAGERWSAVPPDSLRADLAQLHSSFCILHY
jgi:hypothetical protein